MEYRLENHTDLDKCQIFMKHMLRLTDYSIDELTKIFNIADEITLGNYKDILKDKTVVMFFPASSIRTRVTFEKGINLLGGQTILLCNIII